MVTIDLERGVIVVREGGKERELLLESPEAFEMVSELWLRCGWDTKYVYSFTWMGRPIIQLPEDMVRIQEVFYQVQPDVIVETGVAHGGSLIFYASLCKAMDRGRVIGVDIEIRPHNRKAIEQHFLYPHITLIEGDSKEPGVVSKVKARIEAGETVLVLLDSCHTKEHVAAELEAYSPLVTLGSYIVAMDGIMRSLVGAPRTRPDWTWNNPLSAIEEFLSRHDDFVREEPEWLFNEGSVRKRVTYWPGAFLKRVRSTAPHEMGTGAG